MLELDSCLRLGGETWSTDITFVFSLRKRMQNTTITVPTNRAVTTTMTKMTTMDMTTKSCSSSPLSSSWCGDSTPEE